MSYKEAREVEVQCIAARHQQYGVRFGIAMPASGPVQVL